MKVREFVAMLVLLPVNAMTVGYGWMAVIWRDEPSATPTTQLAVIGGVLAAVGVGLWLARLRSAAVLQMAPVLLLVWLVSAT